MSLVRRTHLPQANLPSNNLLILWFVLNVSKRATKVLKNVTTVKGRDAVAENGPKAMTFDFFERAMQVNVHGNRTLRIGATERNQNGEEKKKQNKKRTS